MAAPALTPTKVDIDREAAVTVVWADGHMTRSALTELRGRCPCALCTEKRRAGVGPTLPATLRVTGAELVGAWGLALAWSDGHNTGVYRWELLRSWCDCPACRNG